MSKFKVGDRVKSVDEFRPWYGAPDILTVKQIHARNNISFEGNPENGESLFDETGLMTFAESWFDLADDTDTRTLTLSGATYTLTPYEAPKLVTIDDVVYAMTEVK